MQRLEIEAQNTINSLIISHYDIMYLNLLNNNNAILSKLKYFLKLGISKIYKLC